MLNLDNKKIHDLIADKDDIVNEGREISKELETLEVKIKRLEEKEKRITEKVVPSKKITDEGDVIVAQIKKLDERLSVLVKEIQEEKLKAVPLEIKDEHHNLMKIREQKERERNKLALKIQKIKDKLIPLIQKEVKPLLKDPFDDIETAKIKDGKVVIATFNHLDEFKKRFARK